MISVNVYAEINSLNLTTAIFFAWLQLLVDVIYQPPTAGPFEMSEGVPLPFCMASFFYKIIGPPKPVAFY